MSKDKPKETTAVDGTDFAIGIIASRYNNDLVEALLKDVRAALRKSKVADASVKVLRVPGASEIPYAANMLAMTEEYDCIIALGVIIKGDTIHAEVIANSTALTLQGVAMQTEVPVINGIIAVNTREQAEERTRGKLARGTEFAKSALEMAWHHLQLGDYLDTLDANAEADGDLDYLEYEKKLYEDDDDDDDEDGGSDYPFHKN
ncbi:MAG: 6,7-dimethyl-8-ribityllumazine synthase [Puniceicoccales bacterium]|jgi:6,7-dimethyl-8-ribityllumazine synthase|nr:6,7-dimethyl-8-ribityllumazine synthase [Puniceicoccales bacterium]